MLIEQTLLTLNGNAQQLAASTNGPGGTCCKLLVEQLRTNTHIASVGTSSVTSDGSGTGVIQELAQPGAATVILDRYELEDQENSNSIDPTQFYVKGTNNEKLKITYFIR